MHPALLPSVRSGLSVHECGATGCYPRSACPVLCHSESGPLGLSVRECGAAGSASGQTTSPVHPTLRRSRSRHGPRVLSTPVPISTPPTSLDICSFFIYLVSDFLAVRFSVSYGCARRRSVSTYATILILVTLITNLYISIRINHTLLSVPTIPGLFPHHKI